jgi:hypothetical protein
MLATAVTLAALTVAIGCTSPARPGAVSGGPRAWIALGALVGAALAESAPAGLAALSATSILVVQRAVLGSRVAPGAGSNGGAGRDRRPSIPPLPMSRALTFALIAGALVAALFLAPLALRPLAPRAFADIGRALSASSLAALDVASSRTTALAAWMREVSLVSLGIAAAGAFLALFRARTRELFAPFALLLALDTILPARAAGVLSADPLASFRTLAVASLAICSALGVSELVGLLLRARVPFARSGAVLIVVFHVTLVALTSEEAGYAADRGEQLAAEVWTDEALGRLEPRSAILVRSPAVAWRLWAARITRGERPDVVVIPIPLLNRGRVAASLLADERALEPLLRDFALSGEPSEFALSAAADVRPLHVELDRRWSKRLISHLTVDGIWLEYAPQPLGPSDRKLAANAQAAPVRRVLAAITEGSAPDVSTASVVADTFMGQASVLTMLSDYAAAQALVDRASALAPHDAALSSAKVRYAIGGIRRAMALHNPAGPAAGSAGGSAPYAPVGRYPERL